MNKECKKRTLKYPGGSNYSTLLLPLEPEDQNEDVEIVKTWRLKGGALQSLDFRPLRREY